LLPTFSILEITLRISEIIASLIPKVRPVGPARETSPAESTSRIYSRPDEVHLSGESQLLAKLKSEVAKLPEIDEAKVAELKARIDAGEYNPSAKDIAAKILGE
jgi:negative regulator of flagellin synthesis FlgM